jgi:cytochrome c553
MRWLGLAAALLGGAGSGQSLAGGKDVYGPCAACHGANAEGGKGGEYPRLAGLPVDYLINQLKAFQQRRRVNLPMYPYTEPRELPEGDMKDVAAYLSSLQLPVRPPVLPDTASALERLEAVQRVLVVPRVEGDAEGGKTVYRRRCAGCHATAGEGKVDFPRLKGQWPAYLKRQLDAMQAGSRPHEGETPASDVLSRLKPGELNSVLAWLTQTQADVPEPEPEPAK